MSGPDWDARYRAAEGSLFGDAPNDYLRMICARTDFAPKTALLPADGDGRNGSWLASQGIAVTAFDLSAEATRRAVDRDKVNGVSVERFTADVTAWQPAGRTWDAAIVFYLHGPASLRRACLDKAIASLAPGGWIVLEAFAKAPQPATGPGPGSPALRYSNEELAEWVGELQIVELMAGTILLDEGSRHSGLADVVRLAARRS
ncbi:MAG: class I SAM-dependent methyltransferase [Rhodobiaceae bacterium]|nr:class I SAM-dependent methyltransferase [Rhodobiaceae bacterium]MCC0015555.1 class I SAM-dependent methyltransferase [Rhodobiaceae bacterium]MCC0040879.1 class I SAM-dependent methyltransferase [Rhodobiaceae bacterium]MCC0053206.1 class I SAM-dependent methyltransferase [Rhodobiaceae bacterium]